MLNFFLVGIKDVILKNFYPTKLLKMENIFKNKILPAVTFDDDAKAVKVANAFLLGGLDLMEVPLRTAASIASIKLIKKEFPQMIIGAGTILTVNQLHEAKDIGAAFGLAPALNPSIIKEALRINFPFIPGVMTPSEIELAYELGCKILKLFPAAQIGGLEMTKALEGPYGHLDIKIIPMGGVNNDNLKKFINLKMVLAVGGSWLASKGAIANEDYEGIKNNVATALKITKSVGENLN